MISFAFRKVISVATNLLNVVDGAATAALVATEGSLSYAEETFETSSKDALKASMTRDLDRLRSEHMYELELIKLKAELKAAKNTV
jgi:hypothetical protein